MARNRRLGGLLLPALLSTGSGAVAASVPASAPCESPAHHQLDFWIGRWDVYTVKADKLVAHSLIEKLYGGCTIRENWMPLANAGGGSLNSYRPEDDAWHQYWVDAHNNVSEYIGRADPKGIRWSGQTIDRAGAVHKIRMTYTRLDDASVRQTCENSPDGGSTWQVDCDLIYRRSAGDGAFAAAR